MFLINTCFIYFYLSLIVSEPTIWVSWINESFPNWHWTRETCWCPGILIKNLNGTRKTFLAREVAY